MSWVRGNFSDKSSLCWVDSLNIYLSTFQAQKDEPTPRTREKSSLEPPKKRIKKEKMSKAQNGASSKTRSSDSNGNHTPTLKLSKRDQVWYLYPAL